LLAFFIFFKLDKIFFNIFTKWCYGVIMGRGDFMAYFLKKSNLKKGTYLQIYESFYDPRKKNTAHRSYKARLPS